MNEKTCKACGKALPEAEFYSGFSKCKECVKTSVRSNRAANIDYYRNYDKLRANNPDRVAARIDYTNTDSGKLAHKRAQEKWKETNRTKRVAQGKVAYALRAGKLNKLPCFVCGRPDAHAHHPDYSSPLDVVWLCPACHKAAHAIAA